MKYKKEYKREGKEGIEIEEEMRIVKEVGEGIRSKIIPNKEKYPTIESIENELLECVEEYNKGNRETERGYKEEIELELEEEEIRYKYKNENGTEIEIKIKVEEEEEEEIYIVKGIELRIECNSERQGLNEEYEQISKRIGIKDFIEGDYEIEKKGGKINIRVKEGEVKIKKNEYNIPKWTLDLLEREKGE